MLVMKQSEKNLCYLSQLLSRKHKQVAVVTEGFIKSAEWKLCPLCVIIKDLHSFADQYLHSTFRRQHISSRDKQVATG